MIRPALYAALAFACGATQVVLLLAVRRDTDRLASLMPASPRDAARRATFSFERVGRAVLRMAAGRRTSPSGSEVDPVTARSIGGGTVFAACLLPFGPLVAALGALAGSTWPRLINRRDAKARRAALVNDLPEVVDLLALALGAGLNVPLAVEAVGRRGTGPLAAEMASAAEATRRGQRLADALDDLADRCGDQVRPLMSLLASGERYGVPLGESLDRLAVDVRGARRRQAEEAARRLPVKMLFPLVVCILPAFALLTLGPLLLTSFGDLGW